MIRDNVSHPDLKMGWEVRKSQGILIRLQSQGKASVFYSKYQQKMRNLIN